MSCCWTKTKSLSGGRRHAGSNSRRMWRRRRSAGGSPTWPPCPSAASWSSAGPWPTVPGPPPLSILAPGSSLHPRPSSEEQKTPRFVLSSTVCSITRAQEGGSPAVIQPAVPRGLSLGDGRMTLFSFIWRFQQAASLGDIFRSLKLVCFRC